MHATALKRKLRNTQSQWGKNTFKWPFFTETGKVGIQNPDFSYLPDVKYRISANSFRKNYSFLKLLTNMVG